MARFRFRLATLLRLREAARDERRSQLAEAQRAEDKLHARRAAIHDEQRELAQLVRAAGAAGAVAVDRLIAAQRYEAVLQAEWQVTADHLTKIQAEVERRRQALVAADRDVRVLERLHDAQRQRHEQAEALAHAKLLDEIGQRGHVPQEAL